MGKIKEILVDIKFPILYFIIPILLLIELVQYAFKLNFEMIFGRYNYTGSEQMSLFGYLDLSHYRYFAAQEILGWQFFFGNLQFFIIFSILSAGLFHIFRLTRRNSENEQILLEPPPKLYKSGKISLIIILGIIVFEAIVSYIGDPQTGLGSPIYIVDYFQNIPELIFNGYYVINNQPYFPQVFLSFLPVLTGFGLFFYIHGLKAYKERGLINDNGDIRTIKKIFGIFQIKPIGLVLLIIGFLYFIILLNSKGITLESGATSYTIFMAVFWILAVFFNSSLVLIIIRKMIPNSNTKEGRYQFKIFPILVFFIIFFGIIDIFALLLLPHLGKIGIGEDLEFFGLPIMLYSLIFIVGFLIIYIIFKQKVRGLTLYRGLSLIFGSVGVFILLIYWALNPNADNIEINWIYNSIIPLIFVIALTLFFYMLGFKIEEKWKILVNKDSQIKEINENRKKTQLFHVLSKINNQKSASCLFLIFIVSVGAIPSIMGSKLFGEHPIIIINNLGVLPDQDKTVLLAMKYDYPDLSGTYELIDSINNQVVKSGVLNRKGQLWGKYYWIGNFSDYNIIGNYYIKVKLGHFESKSFEFQISPNYMDEAVRTGLYWYYYQRCGTELIPLAEHQDKYVGHPICHAHDAWYIYNDSLAGYVYINSSFNGMGLNFNRQWVPTAGINLGLNLTGGWHDSGDYNVYGTRMAIALYALLYAFDQNSEFYKREPQRTAYYGNNSIPDIIEEAMFGIQFWIRRWYETEQLFFDSMMLGANGSIRWTVFGSPEYEEDYGYGRWIADDEGGILSHGGDVNLMKLYYAQFMRSSYVHLITASFASMARICENNGYYIENVTDLKEWANKTRLAHEKYLGYYNNRSMDNDNLIWRGYNWHDLVSEVEMYRLTNNNTYLMNAINITNGIISNTNDISTYPDYVSVGLAMQIAKEFNNSLGWDGLGFLQGNKTIENLVSILNARTRDSHNYFNYLNDANGKPAYDNARFLEAIFAASFAWNITDNNMLKKDLYSFITRHFDWLYGRNMENLCQMEGIPGGENIVYNYYTRYRFMRGNLRGGYPGFIIDGFEYFPGLDDEDNSATKYAIPRISNTYREVWSDISYGFHIATSAFYGKVLN